MDTRRTLQTRSRPRGEPSDYLAEGARRLPQEQPPLNLHAPPTDPAPIKHIKPLRHARPRGEPLTGLAEILAKEKEAAARRAARSQPQHPPQLPPSPPAEEPPLHQPTVEPVPVRVNRPLRHALPPGQKCHGLAELLAEEKRRKGPTLPRPIPPPEPLSDKSNEDDFQPSAIIASTPLPKSYAKAYNNNLRNRRIDRILQDRDEEAAREAAARAREEASRMPITSEVTKKETVVISTYPAAERNNPLQQRHAVEYHYLPESSRPLEHNYPLEIDRPLQNSPPFESSRAVGTNRSRHQREDSMALLRKLARVTNASPRHSTSPEQGLAKNTTAESQEPSSPGRRQQHPSSTAGPNHPKSALEAIVHEVKEKREYGDSTIGSLEDIVRSNTQDTDEIRMLDIIRASPPTTRKPLTSTELPQPIADEPQDKPVPKDIEEKAGSRVTSTKQKEAEVVREVTAGPSEQPTSKTTTANAPKSALEEIVQEEREKRNPQFGESTIASLENIVHPDIDPSNSTLTLDFGAVPKQEEHDNIDPGRPLTQAEKDRRQEDLALENLNKRLRNTRTTIKDANRGLRRIENKIDAVKDETDVKDEAIEDEDQPRQQQHMIFNPVKADAKPFIDHNGRTACTHCGGSYTSVWRGLWTEFRENFYTHDIRDNNRVHITWLGWTLILWWCWFFVEGMMSLQYSDYFYGPIFPFVTFHYSVKPFIPILRPVFSFLAWSLGSLFNLFFGQVTARSKPPASTPAAYGRGTASTRTFGTFISATVASAARSTFEALDEVGRMWEDEFA